MIQTLRWIATAALGVAVLGCASEPATPHPAAARSSPSVPGFLGDYSMLRPAKDVNGEDVQRYVSYKLAGGRYQQLLLEATQFYPAPEPSEHVDAKTFNDVRNYVDMQMRDKLGSRVRLASLPGPGVVRVRTAITAVTTQSPDFRPYEILPISMAYSLARGRGEEGVLGIEVEMLDSQTGERVGAVVRRGTSDRYRGGDGQLTLEQLRPVLDRWIDAGSQFVVEAFR